MLQSADATEWRCVTSSQAAEKPYSIYIFTELLLKEKKPINSDHLSQYFSDS